MGALILAIVGPAVAGALPFAAPSQAKLAWKCAKVVMNGANKQRESEMAQLHRELAEIERRERMGRQLGI